MEFAASELLPCARLEQEKKVVQEGPKQPLMWALRHSVLGWVRTVAAVLRGESPDTEGSGPFWGAITLVSGDVYPQGIGSHWPVARKAAGILVQLPFDGAGIPGALLASL